MSRGRGSATGAWWIRRPGRVAGNELDMELPPPVLPAGEGKAIVDISGGLHASEIAGSQHTPLLAYQLLSKPNDPEVRDILDNVILVLWPSINPDGQDIVVNWCRAQYAGTSTGPMELYQKYIGHDNNRDFYIANQNESTNMNKWMYLTWYPQIMYNHHQTGPAGAVMFSPPFRDPANYYFHESIITGIDIVGAAIHARAELEHKPGVVSRSMSSYSTWWTGGLRTMAYFHNMIGILTETIGNPTPQTIPFIPARQLRFADYTSPLEPFQEWHFRQSIDYSVATNRGVLDVASKMRENFLFNIYRMGKNSIERGSKDTWTPRPHRLISIANAAGIAAPGAAGGGGRGGSTPQKDAEVWAAMHRPEDRDPRAYVIPAGQRDFLTASKFVNALLETGIRVERDTRAITVNGMRATSMGLLVVCGRPAGIRTLDRGIKSPLLYH